VLRQMDSDNNVTVVLSPPEVAALHQVLMAASQAWNYIQPPHDYEIESAQLLSSLLWMLPKEVVADAWVSHHVDHEGDDLLSMREILLDTFDQKRNEAIERGHIPA
jgi:hypothetical protein